MEKHPTLKSQGPNRTDYQRIRVDWGSGIRVIAEYEEKDIRNGYWLGTWKEAADVVVEEIDLNNTDHGYWREIFNAIRDFCESWGFANKAPELIQSIRRHRNDARCPRKTWEERHSPQIVGWVYGIINTEVNDSCIDNIRCARVGKSKQVRKYYKQRETGCCGFFDVVRRGPDGKKYLIGCNYGH